MRNGKVQYILSKDKARLLWLTGYLNSLTRPYNNFSNYIQVCGKPSFGNLREFPSTLWHLSPHHQSNLIKTEQLSKYHSIEYFNLKIHPTNNDKSNSRNRERSHIKIICTRTIVYGRVNSGCPEYYYEYKSFDSVRTLSRTMILGKQTYASTKTSLLKTMAIFSLFLHT